MPGAQCMDVRSVLEFSTSMAKFEVSRSNICGKLPP